VKSLNGKKKDFDDQNHWLPIMQSKSTHHTPMIAKYQRGSTHQRSAEIPVFREPFFWLHLQDLWALSGHSHHLAWWSRRAPWSSSTSNDLCCLDAVHMRSHPIPCHPLRHVRLSAAFGRARRGLIISCHDPANSGFTTSFSSDWWEIFLTEISNGSVVSWCGVCWACHVSNVWALWILDR
jgi:hypothetical protein